MSFTKVSNELIEKLLLCELNGSEYKVILCVLRHTVGYNKDEDWISATTFEKETSLVRRSAIRTIQQLINRKVLLVTKRTLPYYKVNTEVNEWQLVSNQSLVTNQTLVSKLVNASVQIGKRVVSKRTPTKERITKENIQKKTTNVESKALTIESSSTNLEYGNPGINEGMDLLKVLLDSNPSRVLQNRYALKRLYTKRTKERTLKAIRYAFSVRDMLYAPVITDYIQLEQKWEILETHARRKSTGGVGAVMPENL